MMLRRLGIPLFDADRAVHRMLAAGGSAVGQVEAAFPGVRTASGDIDRGLLGQRVFSDMEALCRLERIVHPLVAAEEKGFLARARARREPIVVLDVPLLFESGTDSRCDYILVVSAPGFIQRQRVLRRPGTTECRLAAILQKQMPDQAKRRRADFVVPSSMGRRMTLRHLRVILRKLRTKTSRMGRNRRVAHR